MAMKQREKKQKIERIQYLLETHRHFNDDYIPFIEGWTDPDENYSYSLTRGERAIGGFLRFLSMIGGWPVLWLAYGISVEGRKKLKPLKKKGAIVVSNHFSYLDAWFTRVALGRYYKSYITAAPQNNKTGFGGKMLRCGGILPFSGNRQAMLNIDKRMQSLLEEGNWIMFYPEQALWTNYQKPRPHKDGAYHYAVRYNVPVIPTFATFKRNKRGHITRLRVHILDPIYPDETLSRKDRREDMKSRAQAAWKETYEKAYGVPLVFDGIMPQDKIGK